MEFDGGFLDDPCEQLFPPGEVPFPPEGIGDAGTDIDAGYHCYFYGPCNDYCPPSYYFCCGPGLTDAGAEVLYCVHPCGTAGRKPGGLEAAQVKGRCAVGNYFAATAHLEAASVDAFSQLAAELSRHRAPQHLVRAAKRAGRDEVRHARTLAALARHHGGVVPQVCVRPIPPRSLEELAIENAVEGCVRETFSALVATWQARAAQPPAVCRAFAGIAKDETRHADLAWAIDGWARSRISNRARKHVDEQRTLAVQTLAGEIAEPSRSLRLGAGLPTAARARHFIASASATIWQ